MTYQGETTLSVALVHHPVMNKRAEIIGSAVTNLDIHDIARTARTYGVTRYFIATPYEDQQQLVHELLAHWAVGYGATYNPARREALSIVRVVSSLDAALAILTEKHGRRPLLVATSAVVRKKNVPYQELRARIQVGEPVLLIFGTAHGLAQEVIELADGILPPIAGGTTYNHLSVRSAASIVLDRLLGA